VPVMSSSSVCCARFNACSSSRCSSSSTPCDVRLGPACTVCAVEGSDQQLVKYAAEFTHNRPSTEASTSCKHFSSVTLVLLHEPCLACKSHTYK
jgi:hypothetical protein